MEQEENSSFLRKKITRRDLLQLGIKAGVCAGTLSVLGCLNQNPPKTSQNNNVAVPSLSADVSKDLYNKTKNPDDWSEAPEKSDISTLTFTSEDVRHKAVYWDKYGDGNVRCKLCPNLCIITPGSRGICNARINENGQLYSIAYGNPCAAHTDPIEKKPFFHFLPQTFTFSFACAGCNLKCKFCQNWQISQSKPDETKNYDLPVDKAIVEAKLSDCKSISYTYTEPSIFFEYLIDTAKAAKKAGLKVGWITAGYVNPEPLEELLPYLDAACVGLKGFDKKFYREVCFGELDNVLQTIEMLQDYGLWFELINLVVPTLNDNQDMLKRMSKWIYDKVGPDHPLHFSRFFPKYKLGNLPPTPVGTLERAKKTALDEGINFVYIGNVAGRVGEDTICPECGEVVFERMGYSILKNNLVNGGCKCGKKLPGLWE